MSIAGRWRLFQENPMRHCLWVARIKSFPTPRHKIQRTRPEGPIRAVACVMSLLHGWSVPGQFAKPDKSPVRFPMDSTSAITALIVQVPRRFASITSRRRSQDNFRVLPTIRDPRVSASTPADTQPLY